MRYGFMEVRVRGEGVDTTCRADAYYWRAGLLNSTSTGWVIEHGSGRDDPRGHTESAPPGDSWCRVTMQTERPLRSGTTLRTGSPGPETNMYYAHVEGVPEPYLSVANPGVLHVDEASRDLVRGRFHLTLHRFQRGDDGPPLEVEGRFEIRRKRPRG